MSESGLGLGRGSTGGSLSVILWALFQKCKSLALYQSHQMPLEGTKHKRNGQAEPREEPSLSNDFYATLPNVQ